MSEKRSTFLAISLPTFCVNREKKKKVWEQMKKSEPMETIEVDGGSLQMAPPSRRASAWFAKLRRRVSFSFFFFPCMSACVETEAHGRRQRTKKKEILRGEKRKLRNCVHKCVHRLSLARCMTPTPFDSTLSLFFMWALPFGVAPLQGDGDLTKLVLWERKISI